MPDNIQTGGEKTVMLERYAGLYEKNKDLAGWLSIEGMESPFECRVNY